MKGKQGQKTHMRSPFHMHRDAPAGRCFWVHGGGVLKNLKELHEALGTMSNEQFTYHTKRSGNDFAKWVRGILGDNACATKLTRAKTKEGAVKAVASCL